MASTNACFWVTCSNDIEDAPPPGVAAAKMELAGLAATAAAAVVVAADGVEAVVDVAGTGSAAVGIAGAGVAAVSMLVVGVAAMGLAPEGVAAASPEAPADAVAMLAGAGAGVEDARIADSAASIPSCMTTTVR